MANSRYQRYFAAQAKKPEYPMIQGKRVTAGRVLVAFGTVLLSSYWMSRQGTDAAIFPGDIGKSITRHFTLSGDSLKISFSTTLRDGTPVTRTLIWKRM